MARNPFLVQQSRDAKAMTAMASQIHDLQEALRVYGGHVEHCGNAMKHRGAECTCGFKAIWDRLPPTVNVQP